MSESVDLIRDFSAAWNRKDIDAVMAAMSPDCVYHNIPVAPVKGHEAIRGVIEGFAGPATQIEWVLHHVAEGDGGTVLTERTDRFEIGGKWIELPVMGTFEVADGKITAWRDYFDLNQFTQQMPST